MELKVTICRKDVIITNFFAHASTPLFMIIFFVLVVFISYNNSNGSIFNISNYNFLVFGIKIIINFILLLSILFLWIVIFCLLNPKLRKGVIGEHTFKITDTAFIESTDYNRTEHSWNSLDKVRLILGYILIRVSGNQWHGIPTRYFSSRDDRNIFLDELKKRIIT